MSILPVLSPPPSCLHFQVGLRAISSSAEKALRSAATSRRFAAVLWEPLVPCRQHHSFPRKSLGPPWAPRQQGALPSFLPRIQVRSIFRFRAITHYNYLPTDYEDSKGLDFRKQDLTPGEVNQIFGAHLSAPSANRLLRIIHGRRVAGSLDDPLLQRNTAEYRVADKTKALKYLRDTVPVDEIINAGLRAEDELKALEEQENLAQEDGKQKPENAEPSDAPSEAQPEQPRELTGRLPLRRKSDSPYGKSNLDKIRAENIAKREAEEKRLEEEKKKREEEEAKLGPPDVIEREKPRELSPFIQKYTQRAQSDLAAPPEMKSWQRLLPVFAMTVLVLGTCATLASLYAPPRKSWRLWPDVPPAAATCIALMGMNIGIWALWKVPPAWAILNRYFLVVAATPKPVQIVGAIFSHQSLGHLALNMLSLWFFGTRLHDDIGRGNFLALYFASGAVGFLASLTDFVLRRGLTYTTLGASGAVYGVMVAFFWRHRFEEFKIFDYPPDPMSGPQGFAFIGVIVGSHLWSLMRGKGTTDVVSHLGGMLAGIASIELVQRYLGDKTRRPAEKAATTATTGGALDNMLDKVIKKKDQPSSSA